MTWIGPIIPPKIHHVNTNTVVHIAGTCTNMFDDNDPRTFASLFHSIYRNSTFIFFLVYLPHSLYHRSSSFVYSSRQSCLHRAHTATYYTTHRLSYLYSVTTHSTSRTILPSPFEPRPELVLDVCIIQLAKHVCTAHTPRHTAQHIVVHACTVFQHIPSTVQSYLPFLNYNLR